MFPIMCRPAGRRGSGVSWFPVLAAWFRMVVLFSCRRRPYRWSCRRRPAGSKSDPFETCRFIRTRPRALLTLPACRPNAWGMPEVVYIYPPPPVDLPRSTPPEISTGRPMVACDLVFSRGDVPARIVHNLRAEPCCLSVSWVCLASTGVVVFPNGRRRPFKSLEPVVTFESDDSLLFDGADSQNAVTLRVWVCRPPFLHPWDLTY